MKSLYCADAVGLRFTPFLKKPQPRPDQEAENRDAVEVLRACLDSLPSDGHNAILACYGIDCEPSTQTEVARTFGISRAAVAKRLLKAKRLLRKQLLASGLGSDIVD